ncbi:MAG: hypothetical protein RH862_16345 [Leptospiraceae bacterium]
MSFLKTTAITFVLILFSAPVLAEELTQRSNSPDIILSSGLSGKTPTTREGYFTLKWELPEDFQLVGPGQATSPDRLVLLESTQPNLEDPVIFHDDQDMSVAMSGKTDGDLYYRIFLLRKGDSLNQGGATASNWSADVNRALSQYEGYTLISASNTYHVKVEHYSLQTAFLYFGIGAFLFIITTAVIIVGTYKNKEEEQ